MRDNEHAILFLYQLAHCCSASILAISKEKSKESEKS
ncbi:hypothetical protein ANO14919_139270 [Xylariales sp. No.14919]|nr:hypothetical protein ANO14919_139270 [Xylariales sp. No.14919]